jgi:integrase
VSYRAVPVAAAPAVGARSWAHVLLAAVRVEFRAEVYVARPGDPVLFGPACAVAGCPARGLDRSAGLSRGAYLCAAHAGRWRREGSPPAAKWVRRASPLRTQRVAQACRVPGCPRAAIVAGLCQAHRKRWQQLGRPAEVARLGPVAVGTGECRIAGCTFPPVGRSELCDLHAVGYRNARQRRGGELDEAGYVAHLERARLRGRPRFDLRNLPTVVRLELQYTLQCRHDERGAALPPLIVGQVVRWVRDSGVSSLLEHGEAWWQRSAAERFRPTVARNPLGLVRYALRRLQRLRERETEVEPWEWDVWSVDRIDVDGRYAHQPARRIYFADIEPPWLKALVKRWARWRISTATKSPASVACTASSVRRFCRWAEAEGLLPQRPAELTRELLERYLAHVATIGRSESRRGSLLTDLKVLLDDVRLHGWAEALPANATYFRGEIPNRRKWLPRFIDEHVMRQIESEENLARLPDLTTRTAVLILIETGLRSVDCLRLRFDPVTTDQAGAPYLVYFNHKLSREATIPISQRLLAQIRRQQADLRPRYPDSEPAYLLPRVRANADGRHPFRHATLSTRIHAWVRDCDIRDAQGRPVRITPHRFRHTLGTRLINNQVPLETVRRLLDHNSPDMTARYATIKDETLRREWERYQERINIRGEVVPLDPDGPLSDAAWAKENLARAKQTLPNGYCGLPLQQSCPHPNACLTCDHFLTTEEFLPLHRDQLERTERLLADAERTSNQRLLEMNTPVKLNLVRIIDGLEALHPHEQEKADAA